MNSRHEATPQVDQVLREARPRRLKLFIAMALIGIAAVSSLLWWPNQQSLPLQFVTHEVSRGDLTIQVTATGTLEPLNQVDVGSEISGTIAEVLVDFNDRVSKGQVLARLNTDEQQAKVVQMRAALEVAEARVQQARATVLETDLKLKRCRTLAEKNLCPPQDLDVVQAGYARAEADEASARAQVSQARATLDAERSRLDKAVIRSPINGLVLKRQIEPGQTVAASLQAPVLFTLAENLAQMELRVAVDEADIGRIREGQVAQFTVDAYADKVFPANIIQVRLAPFSEGGVVSYETILSLSNDELLLRPGMTATAHIIVAELHDVLQVPNAALRFVPPAQPTQQKSGFLDRLFPRWGQRSRNARPDNNKQAQVWVMTEGQPRAIAVKTGPSDGRMTRIVGGELEPGMAVITDAVSSRR